MKDEVILHCTRRGCAQGKNRFIILPCKPAGIFLHKNWILIYMSINAPRNLIIWNFINLSWNCRYSPRGNSQGNIALICQPYVRMGAWKREWEAEEIGSPTGALQCRAEDSIPQKSLREPGALRTCMKVWHGQSMQGVAAWQEGAGEGWRYG